MSLRACLQARIERVSSGRRVLAHRFSCNSTGTFVSPDSLPVGTPATLRGLPSRVGESDARIVASSLPVFANANAFGCDVALGHKPAGVVGPASVLEWRFSFGERVSSRNVNRSGDIDTLDAVFRALGGKRVHDAVDPDAGPVGNAATASASITGDADAKPPMCSCDFVIMPVNLEASGVSCLFRR
jgi:hypothetical protein